MLSKRIIFKSFVFLIAVIFLLQLLEKSISKGIQYNNNIKLSYLLNQNKQYDVMVHGPCEPLFTVIPNDVQKYSQLKLWNMAVRHTDFADNYLQLYLYLKNQSAFPVLLLYITPESLDPRFNTFHTYRYAPYLDDPEVAKVVKEMDPKYYQYSWIPMMPFTFYNRYKNWEALQGWKHQLSKDTLPYFEDGFQTYASENFVDPSKGYVAPNQLIFNNFVPVSKNEEGGLFYELYAENERFKVSKVRLRYLQKIIDLCKSKGIDLVLYESPVYQPSVKDQKNRGEVLALITQIAHKNEIKFWYFEQMQDQQSDFVCPLILSPQGSKKFMPILADSLLTLFN